MKKLSKYIFVMVMGLILNSVTFVTKTNAQPGVAVSFSVFYDNLAPYGQWISEPAYGYVWVPNVAVGFRPYFSSGYWVVTDYGNTWVSTYPWGWAPFHYGRWIYDAYYGWVWVPDDVWGPAWVDWRYGGGVYGWAPLAPGISIGFALGGGYYCPDDWWVFVPQQYVLSPGFHRYYYGPRYAPSYVRSTTIINNTYSSGGVRYISGPRPAELQRATGQSVQTYSVRTMSSPGSTSVSGGSVAMYRPRVSASAGGGATAPRNAVRAEKPLGKPQSVSTNGGQPERLSKQSGGATGGNNQVRQQQSQPTQAQPNNAPERRQAQPSQRQAAPIQERQQQPVERAQPQPRSAPRMQREQPQQAPNQPRMERGQSRQSPQQERRMEQAQPQPSPQQQRIERQPQQAPPQRMERAPERAPAPQPRMQPQMRAPQPMPRMQEPPQGGFSQPREERGHGPK